MTEVSKLYYKYGSKLTTGVSYMFYDRVYDDPILSPFFQGIEKHKMQEHLDTMLSDVTGGPEQYKGRDLKSAHAKFSITEDQFDKVIEHMVASIEEVGVSKDDSQLIIDEIEKNREQIVNK